MERKYKYRLIRLRSSSRAAHHNCQFHRHPHIVRERERESNDMAGREKRGSRPPWVGLAAAVWVELAAGSAYTFALYSHSLKSILGLTQQQLTILGVANDIGENVGILPGVVCNRLPPWIILLIAGACAFFGFGALWLTLSQTVPALPFWLVSRF